MKKLEKGEIIAAALGALFIAGALFWAAGASRGGVTAEKAALSAAVLAGAGTETSDELSPGEVVDINTADEAELEKLPGVGAVLAGRIIAYRQANGPFGAIEDIMKVDGVGQGKFDAVKDCITIGGKP